jgi:hypothetical protein
VTVHLLKTITYAPFRYLLLTNLPSQSPRLHQFRQHLAVYFFFNTLPASVQPPTPYPTSTPLLVLFTVALSHSPFCHLLAPTSSSTSEPDYPSLAALTSILDIAIGSGGWDGHPDQGARREDEKAFNAAVDDLARVLKALFSAITDSGASHMRRTECKEGMERVYYRLVYGVRTKEKRRQGMGQRLFQDAGEEDAGTESAGWKMGGLMEKMSAKGANGPKGMEAGRNSERTKTGCA